MLDLSGFPNGGFVLIHLACANCGDVKHVVAQYIEGRGLGVHPVDEHFLTIWATPHVGPCIITSYHLYLVP